MSKYFHDMKLGESLAVKGPISKFDFKGMPSLSAHPNSAILSNPIASGPQSTNSTKSA